MNAIGLFQAKTKLSEICAEVSAKGVGVLVTRRGKPLVRIEPVRPPKSKHKGIWDRRVALIKPRGPLKEDFNPPCRSKLTSRNPLDDGGTQRVREVLLSAWLLRAIDAKVTSPGAR